MWPNVVKYRKYGIAKFANFVYICITLRKSYHFPGNFSSKMVTISARSTNIQNLQTSQGYIYPILQHFTTKLCNSTNPRIFFQAVLNDFILPALFRLAPSLARMGFMGSIQLMMRSVLNLKRRRSETRHLLVFTGQNSVR